MYSSVLHTPIERVILETGLTGSKISFGEASKNVDIYLQFSSNLFFKSVGSGNQLDNLMRRDI